MPSHPRATYNKEHTKMSNEYITDGHFTVMLCIHRGIGPYVSISLFIVYGQTGTSGASSTIEYPKQIL